MTNLPNERYDATKDELPARDERRAGFAPSELVACQSCSRANAPTRFNCTYCGAELPETQASSALRRPILKRPEEWEQGFSITLWPGRAFESNEERLSEAAAWLRLEPGQLKAFLSSGVPLPVARTASEKEAALVLEKLLSLGLDAGVVSDEEIRGPSVLPVRVRAMEFEEGSLVGLSTTGESHQIAWDDVALFTYGRIIVKRMEVEERRGRTKRAGEVIDARELTEDEELLDVHPARGGAPSLRVAAKSFDYSCLGPRKGLLARDNFATLLNELRARSPRAIFDEEYGRLRQLLGIAWPPEERAGSGGLRRVAGGSFSTESVTVISNETQFTCYSVLRRLAASRARS